MATTTNPTEGHRSGRLHAPHLPRPRMRGLAMTWVLVLGIQLPIAGIGSKRAFHLALSDLVLLVAIIVGARSFQLRRGAWSLWHVALPVGLALSALLVGDVTRYSVGNKITGMVVLLAGYALITSFATSWSRIRDLMRGFVLGVVIVTTVSIVAHLADVRLPRATCHTDACIRLSGYFHDANLFGSLLVVALAMHLATMGTSARLFRPGFPAGFVVISLTTGILLSLSRSSWIGMAVVVVLLIGLKPGRNTRAKLFAGITLVAGLVFLVAGSSDLLLRTATREHSIDSRFNIIRNAFSAFAENPVFGIGLGNFADRYDEIVHNTTLWLAAELGVVGLIVFVGLMVWVAHRLWWAYTNTSGPERAIVLGLGLAHFAMLSFSLGVEALYQRHWWLVMALIVSSASLPVTSDLQHQRLATGRDQDDVAVERAPNDQRRRYRRSRPHVPSSSTATAPAAWATPPTLSP